LSSAVVICTNYKSGIKESGVREQSMLDLALIFEEIKKIRGGSFLAVSFGQ
jgi:hypothetical protein